MFGRVSWQVRGRPARARDLRPRILRASQNLYRGITDRLEILIDETESEFRLLALDLCHELAIALRPYCFGTTVVLTQNWLWMMCAAMACATHLSSHPLLQRRDHYKMLIRNHGRRMISGLLGQVRFHFLTI